MKKIFAVCLSALICFLCASCTSLESRAVVTVGEAQISPDVFTYFLTEVIKDNNEADKETLESAGLLKTAEYVAINTEFEKMGLSLSTVQKEEIASSVDGQWHTFSSYYKKLGITKDVLTKVRTSEEYKETMLYALYDEGGEYEISNETLKEYFYSNYIAFKAINGYLTETSEDGVKSKLSDDAVEQLKNEFANMAKSITAGQSINDVNREYASKHGLESSDPEMTVYKKGGSFFPKNFFDSASGLEYNKPGVIFSDEYIFLVVLSDMSEDEKTYFESHRSDCLFELAQADFKDKLSEWVAEYEVKSVNKAVDNCCEKVLEKI